MYLDNRILIRQAHSYCHCDEHKNAILLKQEEKQQEREDELTEREKTAEKRLAEIEERSAAYGPACDGWEQEKQQLIEESRKSADHYQMLLQMEKQKNAELSRTIQELKVTVESLRVEKTKLMKMIM